MEESNSSKNEQTASALIQSIKSGTADKSSLTKDFSETFLAGEDLSKMDLSGFNFSGADLTGANLSGCRLFKANLTKARLLNSNLKDAEFTGADLTEADMENANLESAGLGMTCLKATHLFRANMRRATLTKADLTGADLRCVDLRNARIREATLVGCDFTGANIEHADMALCKVEKATFKNATMRESRLRAISGFEKAYWIGVDIRDINFAGAYRMRRFIVDQNYLKEFKDRSKTSSIAYYIWWITSDCGRSLGRWCIWIGIQLLIYAWLYSMTGFDHGRHPTAISSIYFSVVTLTTLGYGDVIPSNMLGQIIAMTEVLTGYIMLGGLLSIFSNKMARRGD